MLKRLRARLPRVWRYRGPMWNGWAIVWGRPSGWRGAIRYGWGRSRSASGLIVGRQYWTRPNAVRVTPVPLTHRVGDSSD